MITLLIIADDYTGALDTGVQFAAKGIRTSVITDLAYDFAQADPEIKVLVVNAETRHAGPEDAYQTVYAITKRAVESGIPYLYKKTDSALRGNIGSELEAFVTASGENTLHFLPAFPSMNRTTVKGTHYIDGVPVKESVFGQDPFEPVTSSYVPDIIGQQSSIKVQLSTAKDDGAKIESETSGGQKIVVWDAEQDDELESFGRYLYKTGQLKISAGCAGFGMVLPEILGIEETEKPLVMLHQGLFVLCGSLNQISLDQLDYAEKQGFPRLRLAEEQCLTPKYWLTEQGGDTLSEWLAEAQNSSLMMIDCVNQAEITENHGESQTQELPKDEVRVQVMEGFGYILEAFLNSGIEHTPMIIGGDTLLGCMQQLGVQEMEPVSELALGTVLSLIEYKQQKRAIISKSGGFGPENLLVTLTNDIQKQD